MADVVKPSVRSAMMSGIRSKDTLPEMILRRGLFSRGFRFRLHERTLPGHPDLVIRKRRAAIFVNGCFWHAHQGCRFFRLPAGNKEFWQKKLERNRVRDEDAIKELRKSGWRVAVVWECATRADPEGAVDEIVRFLLSDSGYVELSEGSTRDGLTVVEKLR